VLKMTFGKMPVRRVHQTDLWMKTGMSMLLVFVVVGGLYVPDPLAFAIHAVVAIFQGGIK